MSSRPEEWVGLGFVATIENAPGEWMAGVDGIQAIAAQVAWGMGPAKPDLMPAYLDDLRSCGLLAVGWAWCDARDTAAARTEGDYHARVALDLGLAHFIANMEEPYDAHGDGSSPRFHMPDAYLDAFRSLAPDMELGITTTPRWASNHAACRDAGAVMMPQAFPLAGEGGYGVGHCTQFCIDWGWEARYLRPLCQVYESPTGQVPDAQTFLAESAQYEVGLVPYIVEQAMGSPGRDLMTALVPAITRPPAGAPGPEPPPTNGGGDVADNAIPEPKPGELIGTEHGLTALTDWLQKQPGMPVRGSNYNPAKPGTWPWPERVERTLKILAADHDAAAATPTSEGDDLAA